MHHEDYKAMVCHLPSTEVHHQEAAIFQLQVTLDWYLIITHLWFIAFKFIMRRQEYFSDSGLMLQDYNLVAVGVTPPQHHTRLESESASVSAWCLISFSNWWECLAVPWMWWRSNSLLDWHRVAKYTLHTCVCIYPHVQHLHTFIFMYANTPLVIFGCRNV